MKQVKKPIKYAFEGVEVMHHQIKPEKLKEVCEANGLRSGADGQHSPRARQA